jgi:hypothetical protein
VSFFDETPRRVPRPFDRPGGTDWTRPAGVIPGLARAGLLLIRTDEVAIAVSNALVYPNGFEFTVHARLHHDDFVWGVGPINPDADPRTRQVPEQALRLGILYADGRRARTSTHRPVRADDDEGEHLVLQETGTGGSDRQWDGQFWVHPLPPAGPVTFIVSWLLHDVDEARAELDSLVIREAAGQAVILWPDEP